ncbi:MAG: efflux RND transporter periplasmic adaptor subunit [Eubacterium sp.]|nr:efflux RND transporter periplasmic adaptor subunit [Eubacterium sp.]
MKKTKKAETDNTNVSKVPKTPMDKKKKKKIIRRCILGGVAAVVVLLIVSNSMAAKNAGTVVYTTTVTVEDVEQTLSTSGTVKSEETKTYFAPVAVKIGSVDVAAGDSVAKGEPLVTYDAEALESARQIAELKLQANEGGYESSIYKDNKYIAELGEANVNLEVLEQQIADSENYVKELQQKINDKKTALAHEGTLLQVSLLDWSDRPDSEEYLNLQKLIQFNSYEQQNNKDILAWQKEVDLYEEKIAAYKEYRSEMKSQKSSSEGGSMDSGSKSQLEANTQMERIESQKTLDAVEEVANGILADFDGVVTEVEAVEGSIPQEGTKLVTLESTEKVKVAITVSKYDLEKIAVGQAVSIDIGGKKYDGEVVKIDRMATTNASGAAVVGAEIAINHPDSDIYLGVEARVEIYTARAEGVVAVPVEAINTDMEGDFVFVAENGVAVKKRITTGITSDSYSEVKEGLSEGEAVIVTIGQELEEGMTVTAIPQD